MVAADRGIQIFGFMATPVRAWASVAAALQRLATNLVSTGRAAPFRDPPQSCRKDRLKIPLPYCDANHSSRRITVCERRSPRVQSPNPLRKTLYWLHGAATSTRTAPPAGIVLTSTVELVAALLIVTSYLLNPSPPVSIASLT